MFQAPKTARLRGRRGNRVTGTGNIGGDEGDRTPDLCNAIAALSQLSYVPFGPVPCVAAIF